MTDGTDNAFSSTPDGPRGASTLYYELWRGATIVLLPPGAAGAPPGGDFALGVQSGHVGAECPRFLEHVAHAGDLTDMPFGDIRVKCFGGVEYPTEIHNFGDIPFGYGPVRTETLSRQRGLRCERRAGRRPVSE